ncbi:MAG: ADP-ribosyltransferase domain-containing protein [Candidatus Ozemobacteraceae bacterium]
MSHRLILGKITFALSLLFLMSFYPFFMEPSTLFAEASSILDIDKDGRIILADGRQINAYRIDEASEKKYLKSYKDVNGEEVAPWITKLMKKFPGITMGEVLGITDYSMSGFVDYNKASRDKTMPIDISFRFMLSGMNKLPNFKGTVYRADFFQEEVSKAQVERRMNQYRELLKSGKPFVSLAALSTTLARTDKFGPDRMSMKMTLEMHNAVILEIKSLSGKRIEKFSASPAEEEVLFLPGTRFQIEKITEQVVPETSYNPFGKSYRIFMSEMK